MHVILMEVATLFVLWNSSGLKLPTLISHMVEGYFVPTKYVYVISHVCISVNPGIRDYKN